MKALTIWQPWATLIMVGAKPFEFRGYPAPRFVTGCTIVIHAGSRPIRTSEVEDLIERLDDTEDAWTTGLFADKARPVLERALAQSRYKAPKLGPVDLFGERKAPCEALGFDPLPLGAGVGTVRVGTPVRGDECAKTFGVTINDSDRDEHANWGWPMLEIEPWPEPLPMKGAQGFWTWPTPEAAGL
ncbi:hypothetical protein QH494_16130 [Sphingomonas sp. AR_OL41]|uniref:hypothetical protein n=1 Tax=Sphingomonas sp. AR_OL41 TaxID=3042729 RepID=UPI002481617E|nr:hypothetical protein [Sphingomonas sp. AR_OL41]MDH7973721.1 hypothetical protein [Sphingomonas sp. AR_OL41]